jgi:hypothetical protein
MYAARIEIICLTPPVWPANAPGTMTLCARVHPAPLVRDLRISAVTGTQEIAMNPSVIAGEAYDVDVECRARITFVFRARYRIRGTNIEAYRDTREFTTVIVLAEVR